MADEVAELVVKITGDASDLESTINGVASELSKLEQVQGKSNVTTASGTKGLDAYKKQMQQAQTILQTSRTALSNTKKAYGDNVKSVTKNVSALKTQKTELDKQISLRSNEKRLLTEANKHLDKNSVAYKDNQKALKRINTEIDSYTAQSKKISDSIRTQETALAGSKKAYTDAQATVKKATQQYKEYESGLEAVEKAAKAQNLQDTGKSIKDFGEGLDTVTKPLQYAAVALAAGGVASAKFAIEFEDSFASVKKTVDGTPEQLDAIKQSIIDMSTVGINGHNAIPMTTDKLNELAAAGGQLGITVDNIADFTEVMAQMETATNLAGEEGAATLARFQNVMGISQSEIRNVGSAIVDLGNNSATTEAEIAAMALRIGKYGQTVGMSAADVLGYSAALSSLGIEAQMGGSAVGRTWLSIETAVANGGEELQAFAKYAGKSAKEFKEQWNTDSKGAFNGLLKGLQSADNLTIALQNIGVENTQDIQAMMALVNGYDLVTESVERANTAYAENTALQNEFNAKAETTASQIAVVKNNFIEAARGIGETMLPTIKDLSGDLVGFAQGLAAMDDDTKRTLVNVAVGIVSLTAGMKVFTSATKTIGGFVEGLGKIGEAISKLSALGGSIDTFGNWAAMASNLGPLAAGLAVPAAVVGGYTIISKEVGKALDNNVKLGQSCEELYDTLKGAEDNAKHISALREEYEQLNNSINSGDLTPEQLESAKQRTAEIMQEIKSLVNDNTIKLMIDTGDYETALDMAVDEAEDAVQEIENNLQINNNDKMRDVVTKAYEGIDSWHGGNGALKKRQEKEDLSEWLRQVDTYKKKYRELYEEKERIYNDKNSSSTDRSKAWQQLQDYRTEMMNSDFVKQYKSLGFGDFNFGDTDSTLANFTNQVDNVKNKYAELDASMNDMFKRAEDGRKSIQAMGNVAIESSLRLFNFEDIQSAINAGGDSLEAVKTNMVMTMQDWGMSAEDISARMALFENGFMDLQSAINSNSLDAVIADFTEYGKSIGMTSDQITAKAALMKNGFSDVQQALEKDDISGVINDLGKLGGDMGMTVEDVNKLAHSIGLIPDSKKIEFTANGYEVVEYTAEKLKELDTENVHVSVSAEGDLTVLNQATGRAQTLKDLGDVSLSVRADGNIDVLNQAGERLYVIQNNPSATITVGTEGKEDTDNLGESVDNVGDKDVTVTATANGKKDVDDLATSIENVKSKDVIITAKYQTSGTIPEAKGTSNFPGGLAMVNDQTGIADNRELIVDRGRAFIPEGRNVVLPLSKGAKVYTAAQTKAIMRGIGIPHYASGKNNSDAFTSAKDDWTHYTKTHSVTTAQELEKWLEFQEQYKDNEKDIWDIEEQIFSLQQKLYSERVKESENWLAHEEKYNGMSVDDYLAGINRMKAYTEEYYAQGLLNHKEFTEAMADLDEKYIDKRKEQLEELYDASKAYISEHTYFNDWEDNGDDPLDAYNRVMDRHREALANGELTQEEFDAYGKELGSDMYSERKEQSLNWLEEQRKYFGMTDEEYVQGLERIKEYTQQYYEWGLISRQEYNEAITEINHSAWDEAESAYEDMLAQQQEYISDLQEQFSKQEQALRDSWDVEDRKVDMADVQNQLDIYAGAVTDRGMQKYKELEEQMKQLKRDEELYNLQVANNATIESLEAEYKQMEDMKADFLKGIAENTNIDVSGIVADITNNVTQSSDNITRTLSDIIDAIHEIKVEQSYYNDNSQTTINAADNVDIMAATRKKVGNY